MHDFPLLLFNKRAIVVCLSVDVFEEVLLAKVGQFACLCRRKASDERMFEI